MVSEVPVRTMYLLRGLPGSGKSTVAKQLAAAFSVPYFEADMFYINEAGEYQWQFEHLAAAHTWCEQAVLKQLQQGQIAIVSNTFSTEAEMQVYFDMAKQYNYQVHSLIVENRHHSHNQHQVPEKTIHRMKSRFQIQL